MIWKNKKALALFVVLIVAAVSTAQADYKKGYQYFNKGQVSKALAEFKVVVSLDPKEVLAVYNMGLVNMLLGHKTQALENLLEAGRLDSEIFEVAFQTGRVYLDLKQPQKAKKFLKKFRHKT